MLDNFLDSFCNFITKRKLRKFDISQLCDQDFTYNFFVDIDDKKISFSQSQVLVLISRLIQLREFYKIQLEIHPELYTFNSLVIGRITKEIAFLEEQIF